MNEPTLNTERPINCPTEKEYIEIIKSDIVVDKKFIDEPGQPAKIIYYCRTCKKSVAPKRVAKKLNFNCTECNREFIAFGTENSVASYYNIK